MNYLYVDFESTFSGTVSIQKMVLRKYLDVASIYCVGWAVNDDPVAAARPGTPEWDVFIAFARSACLSDDWCVVAHNASFDVRVMVLKLGLPWPRNIDCSMELAQAWTPNQPGGYSLDNLSKTWRLQYAKSSINFATCTMAELAAYCEQDVRACRELHKHALTALHPFEIAVERLTQQQKEVSFRINREQVSTAIKSFTEVAQDEACAAAELLGSDEAFGEEGGVVRSVKPHEVRRLLIENLGIDPGKTISKKKMDPERLRENPLLAQVIERTGAANRALTHKRGVKKFEHVDVIDCELTYYAAHTGRWSSRNGGKGLNLHNLPKRNPKLAKLIRSLFRLSPEDCYVRGDFANVEYRMEGWLTRCPAVAELFTRDVNADPYGAFWTAATGQPVDRHRAEDKPKRQLAKNAVLGLGYLMGLMRWMEELMRAVADPINRVTLEDLTRICEENRWIPEKIGRYTKAAQTKLRAPWQIAVIAQEIHTRFHEVHPEYGSTARWLERAVHELASTTYPERCLDRLYALPGAPDRSRIDLMIDDQIQGRSVRARLGRWPTPTVLWRDLATRDTKFGPRLTACFGRKGWKAVTKNILIENITQSAARNALAAGQLKLAPEYPYQLSVHDEELLLVPRTTEAIIKAKRDLLRVFGHGNDLGYDWAIHIKESEVAVSESLYEDEATMAALWERINARDESVLANLN